MVYGALPAREAKTKRAAGNILKLFLICDHSSIIDEKLIGKISEIALIESLGVAEDTFNALTIIRKRRPDTVILDGRMFLRQEPEALMSLLHGKGVPLAILLKNQQQGSRCTYLGVDFPVAGGKDFEKIYNLVRSMYREGYA
jgi:chemotaxis response regulator CheB